MTASYQHARPALTVDMVVFALGEDDLQVLLIQRKEAPFRGKWALPGGFVRSDESLEDAARRELQEETGVAGPFLEQLYTFGNLDRDPRERVVTVAYYALINPQGYVLHSSTDAENARWHSLRDLPPLAFDHANIVEMAQHRLRNKIRYQPVGFELLPERFTLSQLQHLYEQILGRSLDKRNFRKKVLNMRFILETKEREQDVPHRAARFYRFDRNQYQRLMQKGFHFEI